MDKSSMTEEFEIESVNADNVEMAAVDENLMLLKAYFPKSADELLKDILEKCNGDVEWASNVLLDSVMDSGAADYNLNDISGVSNNGATGGREEIVEEVIGGREEKVEDVISGKEEVVDDASPPPLITAPPPGPSWPFLSAWGWGSNFAATPDDEDSFESLVLSAAPSPQPMSEPAQDMAPSNSGNRPPSLLELCHEKLFAGDETAKPNEEVHHNINRNSIKRLQSIDKFKKLHTEEIPEPHLSSARNLKYGFTEDQDFAPQLDLNLTLTSDLAQQLMLNFGSEGVHVSADTILSGADLRVSLDERAARELHRCLAQSLQRRSKSQEEEDAMRRILELQKGG